MQALAREDILEAALQCFAKKGFADTKIADIAAAAGYTAASLYTYFPGKKEIFVAAADHFVSGIEMAFGEVPATPPADFAAFAADARRRIRDLCAYGDARSDVLAFFMRLRWSGEPVLKEVASAGVPPCAEAGASEHGEHDHFRLQDYFTRIWRGLGVERFGIGAEVFAGIVAGTIEAFFVRKYILKTGGTLLEDVDQITSLLLYGLRGPR